MTIIFMDGFDDRTNLNDGFNEGDETYTAWGLWLECYDGPDNGTAPGILEGEGRYGGNSMALLHDNLYDWESLFNEIAFTASNEFVFGFAFRALMNPYPFEFRYFTGSVWRSLVQFEITPEGRVRIQRRVGGSNQVYAYSSQFKHISEYGWHYFWGKMEVGKGAGNDSLALWIDGEQVMDASGLELSVGLGTPARAYFPSNASEMDDMYLISGTTTPLGECRILAVKPSGAGAASGFTPNGEATNWECVDEVFQDFDTTHNSGSGSGTRDSFPVTALSSQINSGSTVHAVKVRCMASASAAEQIRPYLLISGTRYYGTAFSPPSSSYAYTEYIWETNPDTAGAWTVAAIDALEIGYEIV
jgi:hypothetical protein